MQIDQRSLSTALHSHSRWSWHRAMSMSSGRCSCGLLTCNSRNITYTSLRGYTTQSRPALRPTRQPSSRSCDAYRPDFEPPALPPRHTSIVHRGEYTAQRGTMLLLKQVPHCTSNEFHTQRGNLPSDAVVMQDTRQTLQDGSHNKPLGTSSV